MLTLKRTARESLFSRTDLLKTCLQVYSSSSFPPRHFKILSLSTHPHTYSFYSISLFHLSILSHLSSLAARRGAERHHVARRRAQRDNRLADPRRRQPRRISGGGGGGRRTWEAANPATTTETATARRAAAAALGLVFFLGFLFLRAVDITIPHVKNLISA